VSVRSVTGLRLAARRLGSMAMRRVVILLYHRVAELDSDPWSLAVTPQHFSEQLEVIRRFYTPLTLRALSDALRAGRLPRNAVAVTFDDGYADNLLAARPLLEHYGIPATIFLPTAAIGGTREFWWDALEQVLLRPGVLPSRLRLSLGGDSFIWELGDAARLSSAEALRHRCWRASQEAPTARHALYVSLWRRMHPLMDHERQSVLEAIVQWAGSGLECRETHRTLTREEVVALGQGRLIDIGSHTVHHVSLATLPVTVQREELQHSKTALEALLGNTVDGFSYPYGKRQDFTTATMAEVREARFAWACSNMKGAVGQGSDPYQLPRNYVHDWDGRSFAERLSGWFYQTGVS
jgi:peptidoglycan/xylan/chitin deacetylase (PgdA/CDA1 family)